MPFPGTHIDLSGVLFPKAAVVSNVTNVAFAYASPNVNMSWTGYGNSYKVAWRLRDDLNWTPVPETTLTNVNISNAWQAGKLYDYRISTVQGGTETAPDIYGYTIPSGSTAPTNATVVRNGADGAKISWQGDPTATYVIAYGEIGMDEGDYTVLTVLPGDYSSVGTGPTATNTYVINSGIDPARAYDFRLYTKSGDELIPYNGLLQLTPAACCIPVTTVP